MKRYRILTGLMLRNQLSTMNPFGQNKNDSTGRKAMRAVGVLILVLMLVGTVVYVEVIAWQGLRKMGQELMLPAMAMIVAMLGTLVMGFFQSISQLYESKDAPWLAVLPVSSTQIFAARLTMIYLYELLLNVGVLLPAVVMYCIGKSGWPLIALRSLPVILLTPALPLAVIALIAAGLMRISAFSKHRDSIVMGLSLALSLVYVVAVTRMNSGDATWMEQLAMRMLQKNGLVEIVTAKFPPVRWGVHAIAGSWGELALFVAASVASLALILLLFGPGYLTQALLGTEVSAVRHRRERAGEKTWRQSSRFFAQFRHEWRMLLRTPAWAYNALAGVVIMPLMLAVGFITGASNAGADGLSGLQGLINTLPQSFILLACAALMNFGSMVNPAAATAYSREGTQYATVLTWPMNTRTRMLAKLAVSLSINAACSLVIGTIGVFALHLRPLTLLGAFVLSQLIGFVPSALALAMDMRHPILGWMNETQAIKKNSHTAFCMLFWMIGFVLIIVPTVLLIVHKAAPGICALAATGVVLAETILAVIVLLRAEKSADVLPEN